MDDTEAVKHNFLTKGFFRRRGFFSLSGMTETEYRGNKTFANAKNTRIWIPDTDLFMREHDGTEVLSKSGRAALEAAFNEHADLLQGTPIMVEGYANEPMAQQVSRERALLVRAYLVSRYRLEPMTVGAIGLGHQPASNSGHVTWSGTAIVFIQKPH